MEWDDDNAVIEAPKPMFLGVLGAREGVDSTILSEKILNPILKVLDRVPERLILPQEGTSSIWLLDWAERLKIHTEVQEADWARFQKRAKIFRDQRIVKEATHFLIFLNQRSNFQEKEAIRLVKKGYTVFTVTQKDFTIEHLELEEEEAPLTSQRASAESSERKRPTVKPTGKTTTPKSKPEQTRNQTILAWTSSSEGKTLMTS